MNPYDFSRVSATALLPVFSRGECTDIPLAKEMLVALRAQLGEPYSREEMSRYAPFFEARFKSVSRILEQQRAAQVLELAAGYSPRGMEWSRHGALRGALYVEADLPAMIEQKRALITAVLGAVPENLKLCRASVLDPEQLREACSWFRHEPVAVTTEGLLRYLTFPEKTRLAANVRNILDTYGGAWITPDIHLRQWIPERADDNFHQRLEAGLGRNVNPNYFDDLAHARRFFEECGFKVDDRPLLEGIRESVVSLPSATPALLKQLEERRTFVLS